MLLVHPVSEILRGLPALIPLVIAGASLGSAWPVLLGLASAVALGVSRWFTTRLRVTPAQVQLRHGLFNRRTVAVPLDRVRTVDVEANLLHRALGLVRLRIGTGHAETKRAKDLTLDGLSRAEGTRLRDELLHGRRPAAAPVPGADHARSGGDDRRLTPPADRARRLVELDPAWIRYGPFSLTGLVTAGTALGLVWRVANEAHLDPTGLAIVRSGRTAVQERPTWTVVLVATVAAIVVVSALSTLRYVLAYWRFTLSRTGAGTLHVTRGLLTTRAVTLEERRVRGVALNEPLLLRAAGGAQVSAVATGLRAGWGADVAGGALLLPPAPRSVALDVSRAVLASITAFDRTLLAHGPAARRRRLVRAVLPILVVFVATVVAVVESAPPWLLVVAAVFVVVGVALARDRYHNLGHALLDGYVVTAEGSLVRRRVALAADAVIGWNLRATLFQRRAGVVTLTATTACGAKRYRILDVAGVDAERFADGVTPGVLAPFMT